MLVIMVVLLAALVAVGWLLVHLLGQNGRLLVRLDRIEAALEDADIELRTRTKKTTRKRKRKASPSEPRRPRSACPVSTARQ